MMNMIHGSGRLLVSVVQKILRVSLFNPYVGLLFICVICGLIVKSALRHITTAPFAVYL